MYLFRNFNMSQIFLVIQLLNPCQKLCLCTLMIAIIVYVAICQFPIFGIWKKGQCMQKRTSEQIILLKR